MCLDCQICVWNMCTCNTIIFTQCRNHVVFNNKQKHDTLDIECSFSACCGWNIPHWFLVKVFPEVAAYINCQTCTSDIHDKSKYSIYIDKIECHSCSVVDF
jgi:hypothetical protein